MPVAKNGAGTKLMVNVNLNALNVNINQIISNPKQPVQNITIQGDQNKNIGDTVMKKDN